MTEDKMCVKVICPFYSAGYCKSKDRCQKEHPTEECLISSCSRRGCFKRHRQFCKYDNKCKRQRKNQSCEFKHRSNNSLPYHAESKQLKAEVEQIKLDIVQLKESNESKQK